MSTPPPPAPRRDHLSLAFLVRCVFIYLPFVATPPPFVTASFSVALQLCSASTLCRLHPKLPAHVHHVYSLVQSPTSLADD